MTNQEDTPDREWVKELAYLVVEIDDTTGLATFDPVQLYKLITKTVSSRDTYWKERVLAIIEEHDPSSGRETNPRYWGKTLREAIKSLR